MSTKVTPSVTSRKQPSQPNKPNLIANAITTHLKVMSKPTYNWQLVFGNPDKDHSYWVDRNSERIAIKDESGDLPDQTDDGVLWLNTLRPIVVEEHDGRAYGTIPLYSVRDDEDSCTSTRLSKALRVASKFRMRVVFPDAFKEMRDPASIVTAKKDGEDLVIKFD